MGYACPVCETPQRDSEHLANHLAFTAMLHGDEHEDWLDEHVDDWGDRTPADLASVVTEFAEETEYDEVFEDTTGSGATGGHGHSHDHGDQERPDVAGGGGIAEAVTDEAVESVLEEAQELTEEMYGLDEDRDGDSDGDGDDATEE
ncbi:DUF5810 domain-containing protein [Halobaculum magnesiiphilum]|uniref:DUF5810 domain-containing protein n=1 Tax=Halobaculum magnesiiphilum TaxID=1017351 RepID=A0A8T8W8W6_9EURY|nr:DUF5810 domain-containing protein [Halobaculum magnesiiphilum]QZP36261.1 DUF5810 domain-containing protein [Halobaculum magnesiiphilum]